MSNRTLFNAQFTLVTTGEQFTNFQDAKQTAIALAGKSATLEQVAVQEAQQTIRTYVVNQYGEFQVTFIP